MQPNFQDPVNTVIDDQYYISVVPSAFTYYDFFIQKNEYEIDNGYILSNIKKGNLYQVGGTANNVIGENDNSTFFTSNFRLSSNSQIYKSQVYQFLDALGTIGGVFELSFGVLFLLYSIVSRKLYYFHMINGLKSVDSPDKAGNDNEMNIVDNQGHHEVDKSIIQQSPQNAHGNDKFAFASMMRDMNNQLNTLQKKQKRRVQKLVYQK